MNRREAIKILEHERYTDVFISDYRNRVHEALDLAIEALKESADKYTNATTNLYDSRLVKDLMGISEEAEKLQLFGGTSTTSKTETVDTPTNTPTNDCISRQDAIEAIDGVDWYSVNSKGELVQGSTSEEESWYKAEDIYKAIESLPPVTHEIRTETHGVCSDCISRQQAIEEIALHDCTNGEVPYFTGKGVQEILKNLPPVTPTERTGECCAGCVWEYKWAKECEKCSRGYTDYYCGAKMGGDTVEDRID